MATIRTAIELNDNFTGVLNNIVNAMNMTVSVMEQMQGTMNDPIDPSTLDGIRNYANQATIAVQDLTAALGTVEPPAIPTASAPEWQSDTMDLFTNTGVERYKQEVQSANNMLNTLNQTQMHIAETAAQTNIFPPNMVTDMTGMQARLQAIQQRIQAIQNNPLNMGSDAANAELEQLRGQLNQAVRQQEMLNQAVENMDIESANEAYLQLSQTVGNTERYIRDNVDEQRQFNKAIDSGTKSADNLQKMIYKAVGIFASIAGLKKVFSFINDCTDAFNTQLNAETQLMSVLANTLDSNYVSQFEIEATADTTGAVDEINAIQNGVDEVVVPVSAETQAMNAAFEQITEKAAEIQSRGIYGDEVMIAAGAEFATYFSDTDAIKMMMDTLTDYAMGMTGGGEVGSEAMVNYATNLGKIMSGSYDAMTKKGFELSDTQKAIIEGTATQEQIVSALGAEYLAMSQDMQAAAAISQVVEESWSGLYENMSNTPQGKIIRMTNAWGDMKETIGKQLYPAIIRIVDFINNNWGTIETVVQKITSGLEFMINVLGLIIEAAAGVVEFFDENWDTIGPILSIAAAVFLALAVAIGVANVAQALFNTTLFGCPLVWILVLIIEIIVVIYVVCKAIAKAVGTADSGFGEICGGIMVVIGFFKNLGLAIANFAIAVWNSILNVGKWFANMGQSVWAVIQNIGFGIANFCMGIVESVKAIVNNIGVAFNNAWVWIQSTFWGLVDGIMQGLKSVAEFANDCLGWLGVNIDTSDFDFAKKKIEELNNQYQEFEDVGEAWNRGNSTFEYVDVNASWENNPIDWAGDWDKGINTFDAFHDGWVEEEFNKGAAWGDGVSKGISSMLDEFNPDEIGDTLDGIADDTGNIKNDLDISQEDLKYLRDIAEQETINRFTTAEITVEQHNTNNISSKMDLDGVIDGLTDAVDEAVFMITEGVHV